jgi:hypothetical protein
VVQEGQMVLHGEFQTQREEATSEREGVKRQEGGTQELRRLTDEDINGVCGCFFAIPCAPPFDSDQPRKEHTDLCAGRDGILGGADFISTGPRLR